MNKLYSSTQKFLNILLIFFVPEHMFWEIVEEKMIRTHSNPLKSPSVYRRFVGWPGWDLIDVSWI